jgi:radical SAM protein with 4Fe4S-binding SPASM domain
MLMPNGTHVKTFKRPNVPKKSEPWREQHHPYEEYLKKPLMHWFLQRISSGKNGETPLEKILYSYRNPSAIIVEKIKYAPIHKFIDFLVYKSGFPSEIIVDEIFHHRPTIRTLVNTARSLATFGLTEPQRFVAPLMVVWNITNVCNLACKHCYQDAVHRRPKDELTLQQKLNVIDQLSENYVSILAIAGGEPLMDPDLWAILERGNRMQVYITIATNGTLLTPENCQRMVSLGVNYVEVSLDSIDPKTHDEFRQVKGAWERSIQGIKNVINTPGLECGVATCFTKDTVERAKDMLDLAISMGADRFVHFNFIPVGRGVEMAHEDVEPWQRERLLRLLHRTLEEGNIDILSTAPQFARSCLMGGNLDGAMAVGHGGSAQGRQAKVFAKYLGGCGAFRCYCSIQPNGRVTPCVYMPHLTVGSLRQSTLKEIWNQPLMNLMGDRDDRGDHCGVCDFRLYCGGCRARAESYTGDIQAGDPGCIYNMHMWQEIVAQSQQEKSEPLAIND